MRRWPAAVVAGWRAVARRPNSQQEDAMSIARVTEISATSTESFDDAVKQGIERAAKTLRGITGAWVKDQNVMIENGRVAEFRVNLSVTFLLED
jgi:flavin-binding protein dodecin